MLPRIAVIVASRLSSSRLPAKALLPLFDIPSLELLLYRLSSSLDSIPIILATSNEKESSLLIRCADKFSLQSYQGSLSNVAGRYLSAANLHSVDFIIRVTADCPFLDGYFISNLLNQVTHFEDYTLWTTKGIFPQGIDIELFSTNLLSHSIPSMSSADLEHLTTFFYDNRNVRIRTFAPPFSLPVRKFTNYLPFTLDTYADYLRLYELTTKLPSPLYPLASIVTD